jgi:hypothetical protein
MALLGFQSILNAMERRRFGLLTSAARLQRAGDQQEKIPAIQSGENHAFMRIRHFQQ